MSAKYKGLNELHITAYHEAGHGVASISVSLPFEKVSIIPDEKSLGQLIHTRIENFNPDCDTDKRTINLTKKHIFTALAGPVTEFRLTEKKNNPAFTQDFTKSVTLTSYLCGSQEEVDAYIDFMWEATTNAIKLNWLSVEKLAQHLINFRQLSYRKVRTLIKDEIIPINLL